MRGVNKAIIIGHLGNDPETRYTGNGDAITNISVATSEKWKDKKTGEDQERTEWHRITFFGRLAEIASEYLKKGAPVYIEGTIRTDKYTDKDGVERYSTKIIANHMQMLGSKKDGEGGGENRQQSKPQQSNQQSQPRQPAPAQSGFEDDDIPF